jgi:hypothetical protein
MHEEGLHDSSVAITLDSSGKKLEATLAKKRSQRHGSIRDILSEGTG